MSVKKLESNYVKVSVYCLSSQSALLADFTPLECRERIPEDVMSRVFATRALSQKCSSISDMAVHTWTFMFVGDDYELALSQAKELETKLRGIRHISDGVSMSLYRRVNGLFMRVVGESQAKQAA
jgi:hypothetical protein